MEIYNYTIIIPHHNIPDLLKRCLSSIPMRDDVQVIVVDDKSDKDSLEALREVEACFPYAHFEYLEEKKYAGHARNVGLLKAEGKYILFADADDFFNECFNQILDDYANAEYDAVYFDANSVDTDTYEKANRSHHINRMIKMYDKKPQRALLNLKYMFGEPWCKMVKREVIEKNGIQFSETIIHNDTKYSYLVGYYSSKICVDKRAMYCVTDRLGSVSKRVSLDRLYVRAEVFAESNQFFKEHNIKMFNYKALRPLLHFLSRGEMKNARKCVSILKAYGMNDFSIAYRLILFPKYILKRVWFLRNKFEV